LRRRARCGLKVGNKLGRDCVQPALRSSSATIKPSAGTLIHEVSHFMTVGGTDDVGSASKDWKAVDFAGMNPLKYDGSHAAYGGTRAARLAISHPELALMTQTASSSSSRGANRL
jgi:hypothetical protein